MARKNGLAVLGLVAGLMACTSSWAGLNDGLVAYYPFDSDTNDASGNGNHGIINGGVTLVNARVGKGAKLNGVNSAGGTRNPDFIRVPNSSSLQFTNEMSVSYWVRIDGDRKQTGDNCSGDAVPGQLGAVLAKKGDRSGWYTMEATDSAGLGINPYTGGQGASMNAIATANQNFRHIAYAISGNTIRSFINGSLVSTTTGSVNFASSNANDLYIGVQNNAGGACLTYWYPLDGVIDEVRIYNRAITDAEVGQLASGQTGTCDTASAYNQGVAAGQAACAANPASCGISVGTGTASGRAVYRPTTNMVNIPYLDVPSLFGGTFTYEVDLELMPNSDPMQFRLRNARQVP